MANWNKTMNATLEDIPMLAIRNKRLMELEG